MAWKGCGCKPLVAETPLMLLLSLIGILTALLSIPRFTHDPPHVCGTMCLSMLSQHTLSLLLLVAAGIGAFSLALGTRQTDVESSRLQSSRKFVRSTIKTSLFAQSLASICLWAILVCAPDLFSLPLLLSTHCVRLGILLETILRLFVLPVADDAANAYPASVLHDAATPIVDSVRVSLFSPLLLAPTMLSAAGAVTAAFGITLGAAWLCVCILVVVLTRRLCNTQMLSAGYSSHRQHMCVWFSFSPRTASVRYNVHRLEAKHKAAFKHHVENSGQIFRVALFVLWLSTLSVGLAFYALGFQHLILTLGGLGGNSWFEDAYSQSWPLIVYCQGQLASSVFLIALGIVLDTAFFRTMMLEVVQQRSNSTALLRWLSHECRSPVAAAMLALQELEESSLPKLMGSQAPRVDTQSAGFRMNSDTMLHTGSERLISAVPHDPARAAFLKGRNGADRVGVVADGQHIAAIQDLRANIKLVKQPVQSLSGVLDNMLVYLRRQREGFKLGSESGSNERLKLHSAWQTAWRNATANEDVPAASLTTADLRMQFESTYHRATMTDSAWVGTLPVLRMLRTIHATSTVSQATVVQVLTNYLTNALKYGRNATGTMRMDINFALHTMPSDSTTVPELGSAGPSLSQSTSAGVGLSREEAEEKRLRRQLNAALAGSRAWVTATLRKHERGSSTRTDSSMNSVLYRFSRTVNSSLNDQCVAGALQITVQDFGRGLEEADRESLFQPFARLRTSDLSVPGNGLGLWLMRQLVESQGGSVSAESAGPGTGSKFVLTFPILLRVHTDNKASVQSGRSAGVLSDSSSADSSDDSSSREENRLFVEPPLRKSRSSIISVNISAPPSGLLRTISVASPSQAHAVSSLRKSSSPAMIQRHTSNPRGSHNSQHGGAQLSMSSLLAHGVSPVAPEAAEGVRLLVVDDAKTIRLLLKKQLSRLGFIVQTAEDGVDGAEQWGQALQSEARFHAVVTDMTMPRMDGCDLCKHIRENEGKAQTTFPRTVIIGVTGNVLPEDVQRFRDAGADAVLAKPLSGALLADKLKELGVNCV